jgi:hypothetical protein
VLTGDTSPGQLASASSVERPDYVLARVDELLPQGG